MSRAVLVDDVKEDPKQEIKDQLTTDDEQVEESQPEVALEDDLPEKYRGKSLKDIVQMHQEAEKLLGKQSSEVGELRKLVDQEIQAQLEKVKTPEPKQEDDVDFFVDPDTSVNRKIENHPAIKEAKEYITQAKKQTALQQLQSNHPDMKQILGDAKFAEWVKASKIRTQLFVQADQQYDYDAANELFSLWKERKQVAEQTAVVEKQVRKNQVKSASTGTARGSAEKAAKKIYRRTDIIRLMRTDPQRYAERADEFLQAYAEGRVK